MASKKRMSADTMRARQNAQLKQVGKFYSGKGSGSADTQAARGASRRSATYKAVGSEGPKKKAAPAKAAGGRGKAVPPTKRPTSNARPGTKQRGGQGSKSPVPGIVAATGIVGAAAAAGRAGGRAMGRAAYTGNVYNSNGTALSSADRKLLHAATRRSGRDAWGQTLPRTARTGPTNLGTSGFGRLLRGGGARLMGR